MTKAEEIATKVSRDLQSLTRLVTGNGTVEGSIVGRLKALEDDIKEILKRLNEIETRPCREPCIYEVAIEREEEMQENKRSWRIGDVANYIQLAVLFLIAYGMFIQ